MGVWEWVEMLHFYPHSIYSYNCIVINACSARLMSILFVHFSVLFAIEYTVKWEQSGECVRVSVCVHVMNVNGREVNFSMKFK